MSDIDFVVLWLDDKDPIWQRERDKYLPTKRDSHSTNDNRFRDWDLFKYWIRGVEQNAPWVRRIYIVTFGHHPKCLDVKNEKIKLIKHSDIIPKEYLPTFNSNVIQYYLHKIPGLSEKFVLFDDDTFILKKVNPTDFFKKDKIKETYGEYPIVFCGGDNALYPYTLANNISYINENYEKIKMYKKHPLKYFSPKNGIKNIFRTATMLPNKTISGFYSPHICQSYTKKLYEEMWEDLGPTLKAVSNNRFRKKTDYTTFLIRYIAFGKGDFYPRSNSFGKRFETGRDTKKIAKAIAKRKYKVICVNDSDSEIDFENEKRIIHESFSKIYPAKSKFEL